MSYKMNLMTQSTSDMYQKAPMKFNGTDIENLSFRKKFHVHQQIND